MIMFVRFSFVKLRHSYPRLFDMHCGLQHTLHNGLSTYYVKVEYINEYIWNIEVFYSGYIGILPHQSI